MPALGSASGKVVHHGGSAGGTKDKGEGPFAALRTMESSREVHRYLIRRGTGRRIGYLSLALASLTRYPA
jgi:hypothetical protein